MGRPCPGGQNPVFYATGVDRRYFERTFPIGEKGNDKAEADGDFKKEEEGL